MYNTKFPFRLSWAPIEGGVISRFHCNSFAELPKKIFTSISIKPVYDKS